MCGIDRRRSDKMKKVFRNRNFYFMVLIDIVLVAAAYWCAYLLRFEGRLPAPWGVNFKQTLPFIIATKIVIFFACNLYRGMWRFTSLSDIVNAVKAAVLSSVIIVLAILFIYRFEGFPRSVFILDCILTLCFICGIRIAIRLFLAKNPTTLWYLHSQQPPIRKNIVIVGAGSAGEKAIREILENPALNMMPVGLLDDDPGKQGKSIHGVPVLGKTDMLRDLADSCDEILIAIPSLKSEDMRRIVAHCEATGKKFRTMPSLGELIGGKLSINTVREVTIEDVLGRGEVKLEEDRIYEILHNKNILVTGAGGSIGSELIRQIARFHPQSVTLIDFSEYNLFQIELECRRKFTYIPMVHLLADIRDIHTMRRIFHQVKPDIVFHAAAYKHVPIQELHPWEAVTNNVGGTQNLLETALETGVERFIFVSTDKAVRPTNVMGATKRIAEMLVESANACHTTKFMSVRFGNVLSSSGSAVPIFQEQIARGGPVTVTHPEVTRYFMTIPEAAQLILQAASMGEGGETFLLDMGKPVRILDLVEDLIRLHGLEPQKDIPIQFIGLRPGEKLVEELMMSEEGIVSTAHEKIMVLKGKEHDYEMLKIAIASLYGIAKTCNASVIKNKLAELVPEYAQEPETDRPLSGAPPLETSGVSRIYRLK